MIDVNERWIIDVSDQCYMPALKSSLHVDKKSGQEKYSHSTYFTGLSGALNYIAKEDIRERLKGASTALPEALTAIREVYNQYEKLLREVTQDDTSTLKGI